MQTYGERLVEKLLRALPAEEYFWCKEPHIANVKYSNRQNPDFIIIGAWIGVIVLEIKDWVRIRSANQRNFEIERRDGTIAIIQNPVLTAREYTLNLLDNFRKRNELIHNGGQYDGKFKFPWRYAVAMPNIDAKIVELGVEHGIWDSGAILGKDQLTEEHFETALQEIPGGFKLHQPLTNSLLHVIRGVIDPNLVVRDMSGND